MIPDNMIKKAKAAYINKRRKTCSHDSLIAALEAVAADIWDEGNEAGYLQGRWDEYAPNPYERNEHA